ncbi:hypothetical protein J4558_26540 [Leptolyngbya sp. 15MV]|nr:hypothetical protein J4558_26540 [Leptolyngbya sp. 15MV]
MRIAMFSTKPYDRRSFEGCPAAAAHAFTWLEPRLAPETAPLAAGADAVCAFVNDDLSAPVLRRLHEGGVRAVLLRCAGFNNVDLKEAARLGLPVARVPAYSPHAVAEFTIGLLLSVVRHIHRAHARTRDGNFALEGLLGFDLHGRTAGVIGTGKIGALVARALAAGFGCRVLAHDVRRDPALEAGAGLYLRPQRISRRDRQAGGGHCSFRRPDRAVRGGGARRRGGLCVRRGNLAAQLARGQARGSAGQATAARHRGAVRLSHRGQQRADDGGGAAYPLRRRRGALRQPRGRAVEGHDADPACGQRQARRPLRDRFRDHLARTGR